MRYPYAIKILLLVVAGGSFASWFVAVAVHTHLNPALSALLTSNPVISRALRGDVGTATVGISSLSVFLGSVFALRLERNLRSAIFDSLFLGSVLTFGYELWVLLFQTSWFFGRFTILSGQSYLGGGLTNQLVAEVSLTIIILYSAYQLGFWKSSVNRAKPS